jgi:NDP-sugar pyrophosphorylase family protein
MQKVDAIILCGGQGTRLAPAIGDIPKPLAPVLGRPFLDHLLAVLDNAGVARSATLAIHYLADRIEAYYDAHRAPLTLHLVREKSPLGTGGAIMNCLDVVQGPRFLCFNGDSLCGGNLMALLAAHEISAPGITLGLVQVADTSRYGRVVTDQTGRIVEFSEKSSVPGSGLINAGIYVIDREVLEPWDGRALSMERDILPRLVRAEKVRGFVLSGPFIDIGLPETYAAASEFISRMRDAERANRIKQGDARTL